MEIILLNLKKIIFVNHDLQKFAEFTMNNYMVAVCDTEDGTTHLVPMKWARGLEKASLLSLMHMPHFGHSLELNACVKKLLVSFHSGFLWLE